MTTPDKITAESLTSDQILRVRVHAERTGKASLHDACDLALHGTRDPLAARAQVAAVYEDVVITERARELSRHYLGCRTPEDFVARGWEPLPLDPRGKHYGQLYSLEYRAHLKARLPTRAPRAQVGQWCHAGRVHEQILSITWDAAVGFGCMFWRQSVAGYSAEEWGASTIPGLPYVLREAMDGDAKGKTIDQLIAEGRACRGNTWREIGRSDVRPAGVGA